MRSADLQLVDDDPKDVFDFDLDYNDQLVAGIAKPQPDVGLVAIVSDREDLASTRP